MTDSKIVGWIVIGLAIFLMMDAILAIVLGKRYMLWGLDYTPSPYRALILRVSEFPPATLLGIKLVECSIGLALLWLARKLVE
jgi:hypothetical protein